MTNDLTTIEAIYNSTINLTCSAYGNPKPTVNNRKIFLILSKNASRLFGFKMVVIYNTVMII